MPGGASNVEERAVASHALQDQFSRLTPRTGIAVKARLPTRISIREVRHRKRTGHSLVPGGLVEHATSKRLRSSVDGSVRWSSRDAVPQCSIS